MRPLTSDDRALIHALRVEKGCRVLRMMNEFRWRRWKRSTVDDLIKRIDETGRKKSCNPAGSRLIKTLSIAL